MIYAINTRTKEHVDVSDMHMPHVAKYVNSYDWELKQADADGWIEWDSGECSGCICTRPPAKDYICIVD